MSEFDIEDSLNEKQQEAVHHTEGPLLILAGAGSGKTRVIVHRIAHLVDAKGVAPWNILAITFTNKAAVELRERTSAFLGPRAQRLWLGTFHSSCNRILRENPWKKESFKDFVIYDESDSSSLVKKCLKDLNISSELYPHSSVKWRIERLKDGLTTPEQFMNSPLVGPLDEKVAAVYPLYQKRLREARAFDFGDLIMVVTQLLESDRAVLEGLQDRFRYIMVDEYQDTNYAQFRLLQLLGAKYGNVCVVGDDDQSIYRWRGANLENILHFESHYPAACVVKLEENYRSTKTILGAASAVISKNVGRKDKKLWTKRRQGELITRHVADDERSEAEYICRTVRELVSENLNYRDIAVFYRTNAQSRVIEEFLRAEDIPYQVVGDIQFYQRKEIKDLIAYLKFLANPADSVSLRRVINLPPRGIGDKTIGLVEELSEREGVEPYRGIKRALEQGSLPRGPENRLREFVSLVEELLGDAETLDPAGLLQKIVKSTGYFEYLEKSDAMRAADRRDNVNEFISAARQFVETQSKPTLQNFLDRLSLVSGQDSYDQSAGAVTLMTMHSSKGLEFPVVFMAGMEEGLCPHSRSSDSEEELEEERRLCYVGMTRAQEKLFLLRARRRSLHGKTWYNQPSPFLEDVPGEFIKITDDESRFRGKRSTRSAQIRRKAGAPLPGDEGGPFRKGSAVMHPKFGMGIVFSREGDGEGMKLVVNFKKHGQKKLLAKFADLKEI